MKQALKGYLYVVISAVIFGCMPLGAKFIYASGVNPLTLVLLRNSLALPVLALLVKFRGESLSITRSQGIKICFLSGMGSCVTPVLLFSSYQFISSGTATTFHFIYPAVVVLCNILFLGEKPRFSPIACVILCTAGTCLFYTPGASLDPLGSILALSSGVTFAVYMTMLARSGLHTMSGFKLSFYMCGVCSFFLLIVCLVTGSLSLPQTLSGWLACFAFSLVLCIGAVVLFQQGTFLIGSQRSAILSTFEPITSLIVGILVFQEVFAPQSALGVVLILLSTVLIAVTDIKKKSL